MNKGRAFWWGWSTDVWVGGPSGAGGGRLLLQDGLQRVGVEGGLVEAWGRGLRSLDFSECCPLEAKAWPHTVCGHSKVPWVNAGRRVTQSGAPVPASKAR